MVKHFIYKFGVCERKLIQVFTKKDFSNLWSIYFILNTKLFINVTV